MGWGKRRFGFDGMADAAYLTLSEAHDNPSTQQFVYTTNGCIIFKRKVQRFPVSLHIQFTHLPVQKIPRHLSSPDLIVVTKGILCDGECVVLQKCTVYILVGDQEADAIGSNLAFIVPQDRVAMQIDGGVGINIYHRVG